MLSQGNGHNYININQNNISGIYTIQLNDEVKCYYKFNTSTNIRIKGYVGTYKDSGGEFLESVDKSGNGYNEGMIYFTNDFLDIENDDLNRD